MTIRNLQDVESALRPGGTVSTSDLYAIWSRRLPIRKSGRKDDPAYEASLPPVNWLQNDLATVITFLKKALAQKEYLLVCDAYEEAKAFWGDVARRENSGKRLRQMVALASCCAMAKTRLGLTQGARNILEPFAHDPDLGPLEQADILLQIGDIVREESYSSPNASSRRAASAASRALYQRALDLNPDSLYGLALNGVMQLRSSGHDPASQAEARASVSRALGRVEETERKEGPSYQTAWFRAAGSSIMGQFEEAFAYYAKLKDVPGVTTEDLADARFRSRFIAEALGLPRRYFYDAFPPLQLFVFCGHLPDLPGVPPRFPLEAIPQVREVLRKRLDQLDARVGFLSASAGAARTGID